MPENPDPTPTQPTTDPIWEVAVPVPLRQSFTYAVPATFGEVTPGTRVLLPFGRRRIAGYLLRPADPDKVGTYKIRKIIDVLDDYPALPAELLELLERAATYYLHPLGEVLKTALPAGLNPVQKNGQMRAPKVKRRTTLYVEPICTEGTLNKIDPRAKKRKAVLATIMKSGGLSIKDLRNIHKDATKQVKRLAADGHVRTTEIDDKTDPFGNRPIERDTPPTLTEQQQTALEAINDALDQNVYTGVLLFGITGSGKTEVYLHAIARALSQNKGALVLVPEITLTPQLVGRYRARFGDDVGVLHSGLSEQERFEQWRMLREGKLQVAIGVRSAVFAPVPNLGIIIVDEEHDGSFKQERGFAYNARDLALLRASRLNGVAVLGSATPSMESYHNAQSGRLKYLELSERATNATLPTVELINLSLHKSGPGGQKFISKPMYDAIHTTLDKQEQIILFINRRGFAPTYICAGCGKPVMCEDCSISLTYHKHPLHLSCHYCGAAHSIPQACPECHGQNLFAAGLGTQKIEEDLQGLFPAARIARFDRDVASGVRGEEILARFGNGETDILVGTQMVTKGHDFPRVTLVGVLQSDVGLHMPDFRASERTFQLLTQVAGRAGRDALAGTAFIQTYNPEHPALLSAQTHDYKTFAAQELEAREELMYPPFGRMIAIRLNSTDANLVDEIAHRLMAQLQQAWHAIGAPDVFLLGPAPSPLAFIQKRHRWQIFMKAPDHSPMRRMLGMVMPWIEKHKSQVRVRIDVDPVSML